MSRAQTPRATQPPDLNLLAETRAYFRRGHAFKQSTRVLKSGLPEKYFVDFDVIITDPAQAMRVADQFADAIREIRDESPLDYLAFLDKGSSGYSGATVGAIVLASELAIRTGLPYVLVRPDKKAYSDKVKLPRLLGGAADSLKGLHGALITDHMSEGDEVVDAIDAVEYSGGKVSDCISFSCRTDLLNTEQFERRRVRYQYFHPFPEVADELGLFKQDTEDNRSEE